MDERNTLGAFEGLAATYARFRPSYPREIFIAMLEGLPVPAAAADVGCGTGISTRLLAAAGAAPIGIDPGEDMLAAARSAGGAHIPYRRGTAEATGLDDASVDLVLAAQAFHWFDPERALKEFHRILRPGGRVALLWNVRVSDGGFTDDYTRIVTAADRRIDPTLRAARSALDAALIASPLFTLERRLEVENPQSLDEDSAIGRATSASYFPREEPLRSELIEELRDSVRRHAVAGKVLLRQTARLTLASVV